MSLKIILFKIHGDFFFIDSYCTLLGITSNCTDIKFSMDTDIKFSMDTDNNNDSMIDTETGQQFFCGCIKYKENGYGEISVAVRLR